MDAIQHLRHILDRNFELKQPSDKRHNIIFCRVRQSKFNNADNV